MMKKLLPFASLSLLAALASVQTVHAQATGFADVAVVSATMGVNDGRLCTGEFSRGDIGCAANAPLVSRTTGYLGVGTANPSTTLTVSGTTYTGFLQLDAKTGAAAPSSFQGGHWSASGTSVFYNSGAVGIGTSTPAFSSKLNLVGAMAFSNTTGSVNGAINPVSGNYLSIEAFNTDNTVKYPVVLNAFGGNVGIGTSSPGAKLHVVGTVYASVAEGANAITVHNTSNGGSWSLVPMGNGASTNALNFYNQGTNKMTLTTDGALAISTNNPGAYKLYVAGNAYSTGTWGSSDVRLKKNIRPLEGALQKTIKMQGVSFDWRQDEYPQRGLTSARQIGLIAQDVEKVIPELVSTNTDGFKAVAYDKVVALLIEAVKELYSENDTLREAHAADVKELRTELEALKRALPAATRH